MRKQEIIDRIAFLRADLASRATAHFNAYCNASADDVNAEIDFNLYLAYRDIYKELFIIYEDAINKG